MARVPPVCFGSCCLPISAARATTAVAAPAQIKLVANSWLIVQEDRWVVRACRYPHLCDSQAVACLPRVPGGPDGSLIVTGAADGSIKWMRNLTELAVGPRTAVAHIHCLSIHSHVCSCQLPAAFLQLRLVGGCCSSGSQGTMLALLFVSFPSGPPAAEGDLEEAAAGVSVCY